MRRGWLICVFGSLLPLIGVCVKLDVALDSSDTGYFLKPLFHGQELFSLNKEEKHFVITQPVGATTIRATYGPFSVEEEVSPGLLHSSWGNHSSLLNNIIVGDLDISAHLVTRTITQDRPLLQVLFHASQLLKKKVAASAAEGGEADSVNKPKQSSSSSTTESKWCLQMHVQKEGQELTSVCVVSGTDNVCVAELTLPPEWWVPGQTQSVEVFYSVYGIDQNLQCSSASNSIVPGKNMRYGERMKRFVSTVTLTHGQMTYQELKEDQHILIYMPQKSFYPGSKFRVPVKLQAESDLQLFGIKVKTRHGIRVIGAEAVDPSKWRISMDINHKKHGALVTAYVHDRDNYSKTDRIQSVFELIFEVEASASGEDPGRVAMTIEYEMNNKMQEKYGTVENRVVTRVQIQHDNTYTIVPVIKTTEIINTAMLTGKIQNFGMRIYSISQSGKIGDITSHTTCHSGDEDVLKVAQSCNLVYLDGSETKGCQSVSVIAKYGRHTKFLFFRVWVPEIPLEIELSDTKLSNIKGWKAPAQTRQTNPLLHVARSGRPVAAGNRKTRGAGTILTHPGLLLQEGGIRKEDFTSSCRLRYQSTLTEVYARFYVPDGVRNLYLVHRKAMFRITDLVRERLRVADESIASMEGLVVEGMRDGRTEVQVMSRDGRPIGAKELKVGFEKVSIERLEVDVVTGLDMDIEAESEMPGTLVARIDTRSQMQKNYQEGILDVSIKFSDETSLPLQYISPNDYFLDMDTLNNHVVAFGPMLSASTPRVIALGQGKGELLKLALELGDSCQRKRSRPLAVSYVYIDVDFSKDGGDGTEAYEGVEQDGKSGKKGEKLLNDASHLGIDSGLGHGYNQDTDEKGKYKSMDKGDKAEGDKVKPGEKDDDGVQMMPMDIEGGGPGSQVPSSEAQQQHLLDRQRMTPLEIGMYVLLGVFCLAIIVFMINCVVFVVKYRRKQMPRDGRDPVANANDWVWIGRATLERNAISTTCQQALMPDSDFNGNMAGSSSPVARFLQAPDSDPSSNRSSGISQASSGPSGTSGPSTLGHLAGTLGTGGGQGSNRNSMVSTYKGSECSIRITANPLSEESPTPGTSQEGACGGVPTLQGPPPIPGSECGTIPRIQPPKALPLRSSVPVPTPEQHALLAQAAAHAAAQNARELDAANGNLTDASLTDVEWDYEAMGLTYEQLMEYFDNLKESTA